MFCRNYCFVIVVFWLMCRSDGHTSAQDAARFRVRVSPFMQIDALGPERFATHPMSGADLTISNQQWQARTSSSSGSTVRFSTDHAFHHTSNPSFKRDARLRLTRLTGTSSSRWRFDAIDDRTNYASGDETATVQVSCRAPGIATIAMNITFITGNVATLQSGRYQMTVVGTISEN